MYGKNLYGTILFGIEGSDSPEKEEYIDLMKYLPAYWQEIQEMKQLQESLGIEIGTLKSAPLEIMDQLFISTATWGIALWERELGIPIDRSKSYERRREIILAKLRGAGTTTKTMIQSAAIAFSGGEVEVQEYPEEHCFVVQFVGIKGIPTNMAGLINAIEEIKPAHLSYRFKYTYTAWDMVSGLTWEKASEKTWSELRTYEEGA